MGKSLMIERALGAQAKFAGGYAVLPGGMILPASELAVPNIRRRGREARVQVRRAHFLPRHQPSAFSFATSASASLPCT